MAPKLWPSRHKVCARDLPGNPRVPPLMMNSDFTKFLKRRAHREMERCVGLKFWSAQQTSLQKLLYVRCVPMHFLRRVRSSGFVTPGRILLKWIVGGVGYGYVSLIVIAEGSVRQEAVVNTVMNFSCFVREYQFQLLKDFTPWNQFGSGQRKVGHPCLKTIMYDVLTWPFVQLPSR